MSCWQEQMIPFMFHAAYENTIFLVDWKVRMRLLTFSETLFLTFHCFRQHTDKSKNNYGMCNLKLINYLLVLLLRILLSVWALTIHGKMQVHSDLCRENWITTCLRKYRTKNTLCVTVPHEVICCIPGNDDKLAQTARRGRGYQRHWRSRGRRNQDE